MKKIISGCLLFFYILVSVAAGCGQSREPEDVTVEYFYENVCASCEPEEDFFVLVREAKAQGATLQEPVTYNVFMDSCRAYYQERAEEAGIPEGTPMPVLIIGSRWASGQEGISALLKGEESSVEGQDEAAAAQSDVRFQAAKLRKQLEGIDGRVLILFTTEACEDCEEVKRLEFTETVLEYNVITEDCLPLLKAMFQEYGVSESNWKVPAVFDGNLVAIGKEEIAAAAEQGFSSDQGNTGLRECLERIEAGTDAAPQQNELKIPLLMGTGFLAGLNPCAISMLLMLLSVVISREYSVWKSGLLYLGGKYAAYFAIGWVIYATASLMEGSVLQEYQQIINSVLAILFLAVGILYLVDAKKVYKGDYGGIRTQLPVGLRRWNHTLIRNAEKYTGLLWPLLIVGLGIAVSLGEFFCTGQIYIATITYLLQSGSVRAWVYLLVYVTAMSLPAVLMLIVIQKTRNTDRLSEFMFRHLLAVKIITGALFIGFSIYLLLI